MPPRAAEQNDESETCVTDFLSPNQKLVEELTKNSSPKADATSELPDFTYDREAKLLSGHLDKLIEWKTKGITYPVSIAIDPTSKCNHRCPGCIGLMGQSKATIPTDRMIELLKELDDLGVRSVSLSAAGDPSCHPGLAEMLESFTNLKLKVGYSTNGELLKEDSLKASVKVCTFVRFSLDADRPEMHQLVHGASPKAFDKVINNMRRMHEERVKQGSPITLSANYMVRPDTIHGIYGAAKLCSEIGMDILRVRPVFGYDNKPLVNEEDANRIIEELERCKEFHSDTFHVSSPANRIEWVKTGSAPIKYKRCNVHHFAPQIGGDQKVYLCCHTIGWEKYCLGDLSKNTFAEVWNSEQRRQVYENIDYRDCATPCSMGGVNNFLHKLTESSDHINFL